MGFGQGKQTLALGSGPHTGVCGRPAHREERVTLTLLSAGRRVLWDPRAGALAVPAAAAGRLALGTSIRRVTFRGSINRPNNQRNLPGQVPAALLPSTGQPCGSRRDAPCRVGARALGQGRGNGAAAAAACRLKRRALRPTPGPRPGRTSRSGAPKPPGSGGSGTGAAAARAISIRPGSHLVSQGDSVGAQGEASTRSQGRPKSHFWGQIRALAVTGAALLPQALHPAGTATPSGSRARSAALFAQRPPCAGFARGKGGTKKSGVCPRRFAAAMPRERAGGAGLLLRSGTAGQPADLAAARAARKMAPCVKVT